MMKIAGIHSSRLSKISQEGLYVNALQRQYNVAVVAKPTRSKAVALSTVPMPPVTSEASLGPLLVLLVLVAVHPFILPNILTFAVEEVHVACEVGKHGCDVARLRFMQVHL